MSSENHIRDLCRKVITIKDEGELEKIVTELRSAIHEEIQQARTIVRITLLGKLSRQ